VDLCGFGGAEVVVEVEPPAGGTEADGDSAYADHVVELTGECDLRVQGAIVVCLPGADAIQDGVGCGVGGGVDGAVGDEGLDEDAGVGEGFVGELIGLLEFAGCEVRLDLRLKLLYANGERLRCCLRFKFFECVVSCGVA